MNVAAQDAILLWHTRLTNRSLVYSVLVVLPHVVSTGLVLLVHLSLFIFCS